MSKVILSDMKNETDDEPVSLKCVTGIRVKHQNYPPSNVGPCPFIFIFNLQYGLI
jgi:hypothetical protein